MGLNPQTTIILRLLLALVPLLARCEAAASPPCNVQVTQDMIIRLIKTNHTEGDCAKSWNNLQAYLEQTRQNLNECLQREESAGASDAAATGCQPLFEKFENETEEVRRKLNTAMQNRLLHEQIEIAKAKNAIARIQKELKSAQSEFHGYYQELLLIYIDAGDTRRALHYYHRLVFLKEPNLPVTMVRFVYSSTKHENRRLENLLALVKRLPKPEEQLTLYKMVQPEIMKRTTQHYSFLGMVVALEMDRFIQEKEESELKKLRDTLFVHAMKQWKSQMMGGTYQDIVAFAKKYPDHYEKIAARIVWVPVKYWYRFSYSQFVTFPNLLPLPKQRLESFRVIMRQIKERNKTYFDYYLAKLAQQVDICEKYIKKQYNELEGKDELIKLKTQFSEFDKKNGYDYYLKNVAKLTKTKPPIPANPNRPSSRGGLDGRR
ncbi:uncharacterized protein LOC126557978 [Anopheles maculipalpis]|uniref:uncharacterized protein LOC126557978 n=1 Tax=Anopheles maculipalpis TaxID=1496333 RepID=UPI0021595E7B|nr:uncharacterized protein LOC126557978 [Anopheles maculipalpis]